jgi:hypothetical protein
MRRSIVPSLPVLLVFPETWNSTTDDNEAEEDPAHEEAADGQAARKFFHPDL